MQLGFCSLMILFWIDVMNEQIQKNRHRNYFLKKEIIQELRITLTGLWIHSPRQNRLSPRLNPKKNSSQIGVHFPVFLKTGLVLYCSLLNVELLIFSKLVCAIEAAAICFVMERGHRKSQQNSRIQVRAEIKLVWLIQITWWSANQRSLKMSAQSLPLSQLI